VRCAIGGVGVLQIDLGDLQVHGRLPGRLVFSVKEGDGFGFVLGAQTDLLAGRRFLGVVNARSSEQDESFITDFSESRNQSGFGRVHEREFRRVSAEFWQIVANCSSAHQFTDTGQSWASKPLPHTRLRMEPVAGFGHFSPRLRLKYAPFSLVNQV
jgi:hypothetical protein